MAEHTINFVEGDGISIQSSDSADGDTWDVEIANTFAAATGGGDPAADTRVWMPLFDSDGVAVLDDTGVIPTLIPLA